MIWKRRRARGLALQALYEIDSTGHSAEGVLECLLTEEKLTEENSGFVHNLVTGVIQNR